MLFSVEKSENLSVLFGLICLIFLYIYDTQAHMQSNETKKKVFFFLIEPNAARNSDGVA